MRIDFMALESQLSYKCRLHVTVESSRRQEGGQSLFVVAHYRGRASCFLFQYLVNFKHGP